MAEEQTGLRTATSVFVTDGYPEHSYVSIDAGRKEIELREALDQRNKIVSISGPSKSGKTTLCDKVFGTAQIRVTGDRIDKPDSLWREAYKQAGDDSDKPYSKTNFGEVLAKLISLGIPLVIDDFHYIEKKVQKQIAKQIKNAASDGLRIVCLSVPHRKDDAVRKNGDLSGRLFSINFDYWVESELEQIAVKGFPKVGYPISAEFNSELTKHALRSPQIMQTLCLEACRMHGPDKPLESIVPSQKHIPEIIKRTIRSYNHESTLELIRNGPAKRGKSRIEFKSSENGSKMDVYECLIKAMKTDPVYLSLSLDEIRERIGKVIRDTKKPNFRSALKKYASIFAEAEQVPTIEWDDVKRKLTILDPHFYFYLRNSIDP